MFAISCESSDLAIKCISNQVKELQEPYNNANALFIAKNKHTTITLRTHKNYLCDVTDNNH